MRGRIDKLEVVRHRAVAPGYWLDLSRRDGVFNVGVGAFTERGQPARLFDAFTRIYPAARELVAGGQWLCAAERRAAAHLADRAPSRPGLLVSGEAAGSFLRLHRRGHRQGLETGMGPPRPLLHGRAQRSGRCAR